MSNYFDHLLLLLGRIAVVRTCYRPSSVVSGLSVGLSVCHTSEPCKNGCTDRDAVWARMGRRNHVLDGGPAVLRDVAMATNFGTQFAITGFVGHNFDCMIASDIHCLILYIGVGFRGQAIRMKT